MITNETYENLLKNLSNLNNDAAKYGFHKIFLMAPIMPQDKDMLFFLVEGSTDDPINRVRLELLFSKILNADALQVEISVCSEEDLDPIIKEDMLSEKIELIQGNEEQLRYFFSTKLIPFSEDPDIASAQEEDRKNSVLCVSKSGDRVHCSFPIPPQWANLSLEQLTSTLKEALGTSIEKFPLQPRDQGNRSYSCTFYSSSSSSPNLSQSPGSGPDLSI